MQPTACEVGKWKPAMDPGREGANKNWISGSLGAVGTHIFRVAIMQGSIYAAVLLPGCAIARVGCFQACF